MDINRYNYEAWFLDYMDGNLNEQQVADLLIFLEQHRDLKAEFENDFSDVVLQAETISFNNKEHLKKQTLVNASNVDDFFIAENEGIIADNEKRELDLFVAQNPTYAKDKKLFSLVYLAKTNAIRFPKKEQLKRRVGFIIPLYVKYAAAAAIALFIIFSLLKSPTSNEPVLASEDNIEENSQTNSVNSSSIKEKQPEIQLAEKEENVNKADLKDEKFENLQDSYNLNTKALASEEHNSTIQENPRLKIKVPELKSKYILETQVAAQEFTTFKQVAIAEFKPIYKDEELVLAQQESKPKTINNEAIGVWEYAGIVVKEDVLKQTNVSDGRLRENDLAKALVTGVDKVANSKTQYNDKSKDDRVNYGFSIGKFAFERSTSKK